MLCKDLREWGCLKNKATQWSPQSTNNVTHILPESPAYSPEQKPIPDLATPRFDAAKLSSSATVAASKYFPQPIQYSSRVRNLQRFLSLPQLSVQLLWFPILKHWLKQEFRGKGQNRAERRKRMRVRQKYDGHLLVIVDRTQWKTRNIMMVCLAWGGHGFPVYWQCLPKRGSSSFAQQKRLLTPVLRLLKPYPLVVTGDREFHSARLAAWLAQRQVDVLLRQKKSTCIQLESDADDRAIPTLGFQPGDVKFFRRVHFNQEKASRPFNLAVRWKRKYRGKSSRVCHQMSQITDELIVYPPHSS
jgi:hypothetical protein